MDNLDLGSIAMEACEKVEKETGRVNVLIAGKTGVGKSTLISWKYGWNCAGKNCHTNNKRKNKVHNI